MNVYQLFILIVGLAFASCSTSATPEEISADIKVDRVSGENGVATEDQAEPDEREEESVWALYEGKLGMYQQQIIMELVITGNKISGNYFYAKHQKTIQLDGSYDPTTQLAKVTESYKGKATGYLEFYLEKGELNGYWMKKSGSAEKEDFTAQMISLSKSDYLPKHARYENTHEIIFYADEEDLRDEVTDVLKISALGKGYYVFYYSVTGQNAHTGKVEGLARSAGGSTFFDDANGCRLEFEFEKNKVTVLEKEDCSYYHGARAYLSGTLTKK